MRTFRCLILTKVKWNKSAKQVNEPLVDIERDLPQKDWINLAKNISRGRVVAWTNLVVRKGSELKFSSTNLSTTGESSLVDQPKDILNLLKEGSKTRRDLSVLVLRAEEGDNRYDTEGEVVPFFHDQLAEGPQEFVKTTLPTQKEENNALPFFFIQTKVGRIQPWN